ncbi:MAG TPA: hypothetical protein VGN17_08475 [Bryobacteraceae bacterium]|jgi:hypothetical protein
MRSCLLLLCCSAALLAQSAGGLKWTPPLGWKSSGSTSMRAATYPVAPSAGDKEGAECAVYFFGAGQGGTVQANLDRWQGQFKAPGGKPATAKIAKAAVHGLPVTTIDVSGDYSGMTGPAGAPASAPSYRLLGAIVEGPGGNIFIKFAGPAKTIAANQAKFQQLLDSFEKSGK